MKNYVTLILCLMIGPILGMLQAWPYVFDYLGSYLHYQIFETNIDDVRMSMNSFGLGEAIGGLIFSSQVSFFGYKRS